MRILFLAVISSSLLAFGCSLDSSGGGSSGTGASGVDASTGGSGGSGGSENGGSGGSGGAGLGGSGGGDLDAAWPDGFVPEAGKDAGDEDEICTDGVDNDGDGDVDCADDDCVDFDCVPATPVGWTGPLFIELNNDQYQCGGYERELFRDQFLSNYQCTCKCSAPSGGSCASPSVTFYASPGCSSNPISPFAGISCNNVSQTSDVDAVSLLAPAPSIAQSPSCTPYVTESDSPISSKNSLVTCRIPDGGSCEDNSKQCVRKELVGGGTCVMKEGDLPCPPSYKANRYVYFANFTDTRSCQKPGGCTCSQPQNAHCTGKVKTYENGDCSQLLNEFDFGPDCQQVDVSTATTNGIKLVLDSPVADNCLPQGTSSVVGDVSTEDPHTICCTH